MTAFPRQVCVLLLPLLAAAAPDNSYRPPHPQPSYSAPATYQVRHQCCSC